MADELKALKEFARAVDKAVVTNWGSRHGSKYGEEIAELRADLDDDESRPTLRRIQRARDKLVDLGILKPVF